MLNDLEEPEPPPQYWSWKKIILWPLGIFLAFVTALWAYDEKLEPYDDLKPLEAADPDPARNGYFFLRERWAEIPDLNREDRIRLSDMLAGFDPWDQALVDSLRKGRGDLAADLKEALTRPDFKTPAVVSYKDRDPVGLSWIMKPARFLSMEIPLAAHGGDLGKAMETWQDLHTLSIRYVNGSQSLMAMMAGVGLQLSTLESANELLSGGKLSGEQIKQLDQALLTDLPAAEAWHRAIRGEVTSSRSALQDIAANAPDLNPGRKVKFAALLLKKNKTLNKSLQVFRTLVREPFRTYPDLPSAQAAGVFGSGEEEPKWKRYIDPNYAGTEIVRELRSSYWPLLPVLRSNIFFRQRALRVKIAILRWQQTHPGQWPASLQDLVPDYLSEIPEDPFNGRSLEWNPINKIITSIGSDWVANPPEFIDHRAWYSRDHDAPGLRMERPPAPAPSVPSSKAKPKPKPKPKSTPAANPKAKPAAAASSETGPPEAGRQQTR